MTRLSGDRAVGVQLIVAHTNPGVVEALRYQFQKNPEVRVDNSSIVEIECDAWLCPGAAFGFMDHGTSLAVSEALGWHLQEELRKRIPEEHDGELLVGEAIVLDTGKTPPWLVYAPTKRVPENVESTVNAYLALRGALLGVRDHNRRHPDRSIKSLAAPALCTGTGCMNAHVSGRQMRYAYEQVTGARSLGDKNMSQLVRRHRKMKKLPGVVRKAMEAPQPPE